MTAGELIEQTGLKGAQVGAAGRMNVPRIISVASEAPQPRCQTIAR